MKIRRKRLTNLILLDRDKAIEKNYNFSQIILRKVILSDLWDTEGYTIPSHKIHKVASE